MRLFRMFGDQAGEQVGGGDKVTYKCKELTISDWSEHPPRVYCKDVHGLYRGYKPLDLGLRVSW